MRAGDFGDAAAAHVHAEDVAQAGAGDAETAFALFVDFDDRQAGERAAG
jgi:hypothetical protein